MWLGTRIAIFCVQPAIFLRQSSICRRFANSVNFSKDLTCLGKNPDEFLSWLQRKVGHEISSTLSVGNSIYGRSLLAAKFIQAGDCILKLPYTAQISADKILPEIKSFLGDDVGNVARLALAVLVEQKMGEVSDWATYIKILPKKGELHSLVFWNKDELAMVRQSAIYEETLSLQAKIQKEFLKIRPAFELFHKIFDITFEDFMHAYASVASRAWGTSKGLSLIPFADFLNHDGLSDAVLLSDDDKEVSEVIADRNYAAGEQVFIRYGRFSNATLMLYFGFTQPHNVYDQIQIWMGISEHDPLYSERLELLQEHSMPTIRNTMDGLVSHGNSFTIKEVRSSKGKGKGIPQSLRAFARVLSAMSLQELKDLANEAAHTDGRLARRPLINRSREIEAHNILLSQITNMIREYVAAIKSLGNVNSYATGSQLSIRKEMARDLLTGELRVLKSASAWLMNYRASCSNHK